MVILQRLKKILDKYHGTINQFQGDAILASFDHAKGEMNPSECAVQAGLDIQKMLKKPVVWRQKPTIIFANSYWH